MRKIMTAALILQLCLLSTFAQQLPEWRPETLFTKADDGAKILADIRRQASAAKLVMMPSYSAGTAIYCLPTRTLAFLALPRSVQRKALHVFAEQHHTDFFDTLLVGVLNEMRTHSTKTVEVPAVNGVELRYFFVRVVIQPETSSE